MTGQAGRSGSTGVTAVAVALALVLLSAVGLAARRADTADAPTVLRSGEQVTAVLADGARTPLAVGDEVPRGATVQASTTGAVLRTRDRDVHLSRDGALTVLDGARQALRSGFVLVDARRGPGVDVATAAATASTPTGTLSRVELGAVLRVGVLEGDAVRVRAADRGASVDVGAYRQVQVPAGGLPGRPTALALTGDAYESRLAPELVMDDRTLTDLARSLDGGRQATVVGAALTTALPQAVPAPEGAPASEATLALLLAQAADAGPLEERYVRVRALRTEGGSWGPVARLVAAPVGEVSGLLDGLLAPVVSTLAGGESALDLAALLAGVPAPGSPAAPGTPATPPTAPVAPPPSGGGDEDPDDPGEEPPPPPTDDPVGTVTDAVETVVETVLELVPDDPTGGLPLPQVAEPVVEPLLEPVAPLLR